MTHMKECTAEEAAELMRPVDRLGIPLGPGQPAGFLHALGARDDWERFEIFGAFAARPLRGVLETGRPLPQRVLRAGRTADADAGDDIEFVPADFRRFVTVATTLHHA